MFFLRCNGKRDLDVETVQTETFLPISVKHSHVLHDRAVHILIQCCCYMSLIMRKPDFCLCENKGADQLRSNCEADQRLCFRHTDSTIIISLLLKTEISSFYPIFETIQVGLCQVRNPEAQFSHVAAHMHCLWWGTFLSKVPLHLKFDTLCFITEPLHEKTGLRGF